MNRKVSERYEVDGNILADKKKHSKIKVLKFYFVESSETMMMKVKM